MSHHIEWNTAEHDEDYREADLNGIMGEYRPPDEMVSEGGSSKWFWMVKPTSSRCEYPEVYDCGHTASEDEAKSKAETAMVKADGLYQRIEY